MNSCTTPEGMRELLASVAADQRYMKAHRLLQYRKDKAYKAQAKRTYKYRKMPYQHIRVTALYAQADAWWARSFAELMPDKEYAFKQVKESLAKHRSLRKLLNPLP